MKLSHPSVLKPEVLDIQVCVSRQFVKYGRNVSFARCFSAEIHDMEIEKIENVFHIDVLQIHGKAVTPVWCSHTIDGQVLVVVVDREIVNR